MSRTARKVSNSGFYHVMVRGIGKMVIFEASGDYQRYPELLHRETLEKGVNLIAWCLMPNHVHLLVSDSNGQLAESMRRVNTCYAREFNTRYDHVGHVFQNRYLSEPIEDDAYLLAAARYIHRNPLEAGLGSVEDYPWSSFSEYMGVPRITSTETLLDIFSGRDDFASYMLADSAREDKPRKPPIGADLVAYVRETLTERDLVNLRSCDRLARNASLRKLRDMGLSIRQAQRVTGLGKGVIERAYRDLRA